MLIPYLSLIYATHIYHTYHLQCLPLLQVDLKSGSGTVSLDLELVKPSRASARASDTGTVWKYLMLRSA